MKTSKLHVLSILFGLVLIVASAGNAFAGCTGLQVKGGDLVYNYNSSLDSCGGHAEKCHIKIKDSDLSVRLQKGISGCKKQKIASKFRNTAAAEIAVAKVLQKNEAKVIKYINDKNTKSTRFQASLKMPMKYVEKSDPSKIVEAKSGKVIMYIMGKGKGNKYRAWVHTVYPTK